MRASFKTERALASEGSGGSEPHNKIRGKRSDLEEFSGKKLPSISFAVPVYPVCVSHHLPPFLALLQQTSGLLIGTPGKFQAKLILY